MLHPLKDLQIGTYLLTNFEGRTTTTKLKHKVTVQWLMDNQTELNIQSVDFIHA